RATGHRADAGPARVRRPAARRTPRGHRRGRARRADAARQGPRRGGPRGGRGHAGPAGGSGGRGVLAVPPPAPVGGHAPRLRAGRNRTRPDPLPGAARSPAGGTGRAYRTRLARAVTNTPVKGVPDGVHCDVNGRCSLGVKAPSPHWLWGEGSLAPIVSGV